MYSFLQVLVVGSILAYLLPCRFYFHQRTQQSWESIIGQIRSDNTQWGLFQNARVLMEIADYVERHGSGAGLVEAEQLASLRKDAMQIRISTLVTLARNFLPSPSK